VLCYVCGMRETLVGYGNEFFLSVTFFGVLQMDVLRVEWFELFEPVSGDLPQSHLKSQLFAFISPIFSLSQAEAQLIFTVSSLVSLSGSARHIYFRVRPQSYD
jgi:hypothetical protein